MKKKKNAVKKMLCALFAAVFTVTAAAEPIQALTVSNSVEWRQTETMCLRCSTPQMILGTYTPETSLSFYPSGGYGYSDGYAAAGETVYIYLYAYTCDQIEMYAANFKGRTVCFKKSTIDPDKIVPVNRASYSTKIKVTQTAVVGNVLKPNNWFYIYSKPSEKTVNTIGVLIPGDKVEIIKKKYNSEWTQIKWKERICYIKTKNISFKDAYLVGAKDSLKMEIKQAKQAKLTYSGILKNYDKDLTEKEFYKLAAKWCKAVGCKELKTPKKLTNKKITQAKYNQLFQKILKSAKADDAIYEIGKADTDSTFANIEKQSAIVNFYRSYVTYQALNRKTNDLIIGGNYAICPADDPSQCLDLYEWSNAAGATIGLYKNSSQDNQLFTLKINNGYYNMDNFASKLTLTASKNGICQQYKGYHSQKLTFEFNGDGTVCIKNGEGLYMDVQNGTPVYAKKSGSSSQKFILKYHSFNPHGVG